MFWILYAFFRVIPRHLNFICRRFRTICLFHLHRQVGTYLPMKMEQIYCSKTSVYKIQTPENYPEESIQHSQNLLPLLSLKFALIIVKNRAGQLQPTKWPHHSPRTHLRATHVYTHIKEGGGTEFTRTPLFTNNKLHQKLQLNDKVVGHT